MIRNSMPVFIETDDDGNSLDSLHGKHYYTLKTEQGDLLC
jgi:hypothetical protein